MCNLIFADNLSVLQERIPAYSSIVVISHENIINLHGKTLQEDLNKPLHTITVPSGEQYKTLETAAFCWSKMHAKGIDRNSLVIGLGGGVITDLAGYVAGCYMRGIDVIHIPTSLLGMVDAAIGGKSAVNLPQGKNLVGLFYHPKVVLINQSYLRTLPQREFCAGLAEIIKYGIIQDPILLKYLENNISNIINRDQTCLKHIIQRSANIKTHIVSQDEKEKNLRAILNWGHTFAHALESATHYNTYLHGEAVAIGMSCAAHVSHVLGYVEKEFIEYQDFVCRKANLPTTLPDISIDSLIQLMLKDKKTIANKISLILAKQIGHVFKAQDIQIEVIQGALESKRAWDNN
jgi:3-dehydroquinate synthase